MKEPTLAEQREYMDLRVRGKLGTLGVISMTQQKFLLRINRDYPEWAHSKRRELYELTAPFGAAPWKDEERT